jgi:hypothetical protein
MAKIEHSRNIILSLVDYLDPLLVAAGYSFTFVSDWGSDDRIVLPQDYVSGSNQIVLPAGKFTISTRSKGGYLEVGGSSMEAFFFASFFIHACTEGQAYDLMDFLHDRIESGASVNRIGDNRITVGDYSTTGYPAVSPPELGILEIQDVRHRYISDLGAANIAMKHAGDITIAGMMYITT